MYTYTRILKYFTDMQRRMRKIQNREYFLSHKNNDYIATIQNNNNQRNMRVIVSSTSANNSSVTCKSQTENCSVTHDSDTRKQSNNDNANVDTNDNETKQPHGICISVANST